MGLLDQLWDDTVAGPRPDTGLGKLRKYSSFSPSSSSYAAAAAAAPAPAPAASGGAAAGVPVTRSITMIRPPSLSVPSPRSDSSSVPSSPASAPSSPFGATTPKGDWKKLRRKAKPTAEGMGAVEPRSPTVYDCDGHAIDDACAGNGDTYRRPPAIADNHCCSTKRGGSIANIVINDNIFSNIIKNDGRPFPNVYQTMILDRKAAATGHH